MTANDKIIEPDESDREKVPSNEVVEEEIQDADVDAYVQLNNELDEINNFLDALEQKNDTLHAEISKLLEESRQIRHEIKDHVQLNNEFDEMNLDAVAEKNESVHNEIKNLFEESRQNRREMQGDSS